MVDIGAVWLTHIKTGICLPAFYLSREHCCVCVYIEIFSINQIIFFSGQHQIKHMINIKVFFVRIGMDGQISFILLAILQQNMQSIIFFMFFSVVTICCYFLFNEKYRFFQVVFLQHHVLYLLKHLLHMHVVVVFQK
jgi:hypothetical protein